MYQEDTLRHKNAVVDRGNATGKRSKEKNIILQKLYNMVKLLTKKSVLEKLPKEKKHNLCLLYFNTIKEWFPDEWDDNKLYRLAHIICLNALAIVGNKVINENLA